MLPSILVIHSSCRSGESVGHPLAQNLGLEPTWPSEKLSALCAAPCGGVLSRTCESFQCFRLDIPPWLWEHQRSLVLHYIFGLPLPVHLQNPYNPTSIMWNNRRILNTAHITTEDHHFVKVRHRTKWAMAVAAIAMLHHKRVDNSYCPTGG